MRHTKAAIFAALALLCSCFPLICLADTLTGEVRGTVLDIEGSVPLAGASVSLTSVDRGWRKQLQTDSSGNYAFLQLEPGSYSVSAEKEGYYTSERTDVLIRLNMPKVLIPPFELRRKISTPTQQITLRGEQTKTAIVDLSAPGATPAILAVLTAPGFTSLVTLLDAALRFNFGTALVQNLPLAGGRTFDQLALYVPGVFRVPFSSGQGPSVGIGVGSGGQFSVNGMRPRSNNFTVDGSDNNDEDIGMRRQGFVALVPQSVESVQEFQVVTAGFPAEAGRNSGSMVNAVSQSGRKEIHGNIYGLFGGDSLDARNFFDYDFVDAVNAGDLSGGRYDGKDSSRRTYGATIGGPIRAERLFYFLSFEQQRNRGTALSHFVVPTTSERGLRTSQGFVPIDKLGEFFADYAIDYSDVAGKGVYSLYPLPNNPAGPFGPHNYSQAGEWKQNSSNFSVKSDWRLSSVHSFAGRYDFTDDRSLMPFTGEAIDSAVGNAHQDAEHLPVFEQHRVAAGECPASVLWTDSTLVSAAGGQPASFWLGPFRSVAAGPEPDDYDILRPVWSVRRHRADRPACYRTLQFHRGGRIQLPSGASRQHLSGQRIPHTFRGRAYIQGGVRDSSLPAEQLLGSQQPASAPLRQRYRVLGMRQQSVLPLRHSRRPASRHRSRGAGCSGRTPADDQHRRSSRHHDRASVHTVRYFRTGRLEGEAQPDTESRPAL